MKRIFLLISASLLLVSCADRAALRVTIPAKIDTDGIRKVAVGPLELAGVRIKELNEKDGRWTTRIIKTSKSEREALAKQVRARVVNRMAETPYFTLVYQDEFERLESNADLKRMIAAGGYRTDEVDAVIHGKFWLELERRRGVEPGSVNMTYRTGGKSNITISMDPVAFWPYIESRANLSMELQLVRLHPEEVIASRTMERSYGYKLSDRPSSAREANRVNGRSSLPIDSETEKKLSRNVLPSIEEVAADLADSMALAFTQEVAVSERTVFYPIAEGNKKGVEMVKNGAYELAIEHLEKLTAQGGSVEDLYNLGLCYEAIGDFGLAKSIYYDTWRTNPTNALLANGLGRIEALARENPKLKQQLYDKRKKQ